VGGAFAAGSRSGEAGVGAWWGDDGPLPDVRAWSRARRRGDRRARPARRFRARGDAYGLHWMARRAARRPR
ncbi:MAG: hypothetical protein AVDCRST_MAG80-282, partial [uncultured Rubrobacteraceae bacterium]